MTVQGFTDLGSTSADNLLAGEFPRVSKLVTVTGGKYERGTILSKSESNYTICSADPEQEHLILTIQDLLLIVKNGSVKKYH